MQTFPLFLNSGHLFIEIDNRTFLFDSGAPNSFGVGSSLMLCDREFSLPTNYLGLTDENLTTLVGCPVSGILGADIINHFDVLIDSQSGQISFTTEQVECLGDCIGMDDFMGIPVLNTQIKGVTRRMFFDSGAQISYFQDGSISNFPAAGQFTDFFPGMGQFETKTYMVDLVLGASSYRLRFGTLPGLLGLSLMLANTDGIIGNEVLRERVAGFFPRRKLLVLV